MTIMKRLLSCAVLLSFSAAPIACKGKDKDSSGEAPKKSEGVTAADVKGAVADLDAKKKAADSIKAEGEKACTVAFTKVTDKGPEYEMTNAGTREFKYCNAIVYGYDKDGKLVTRLWLRPLGDKGKPATLKANEKVTGLLDFTEFQDAKWEAAAKLAKEPGASFEAVVISVKFMDDQEWFDSARAPDDRPKGGKK